MCDAPLGHIQTDIPNASHCYDNIICPAASDAVEAEETEIEIQYGTGVKRVKASGSKAGLEPNIPVISHEVGQYSFYPDVNEIDKYTGVLKAENLKIFRERLAEKGMLSKWEEFFKAKDWVQQLKLRASYGSVGNRPTELYSQYTLYAMSTGYNGDPGAVIAQKENKNLTWEKTYTAGVGIDAILFDRLTINLDYYNKKTTDLLYKVPLPGVTGITGIYRNVGSVKNNGFEVSLGVDILKGGDWNWSVAANLGLNRNKITELYGGKSEIITANAGTSYYIYMDKILTPGQDVDTWYGTEWAGVDPQTGAPLWYTTNEKGERITTSDYSEASKHQTILGKLSPDFYGGFSTNLSWKNIDLSAVFGYSVGGEIYNYDRSMYDSDGAYVNYNQMNLRDDWNRWEKPGDIATHPKAEYGNKSQSSKGSSRYLEDASYLRLRSLTLGYTLPWKIQYVDNVRLSFSGENLFVLSGFSGVDPELPAEVGSQYKAGSVGVAISPYPQARKFMFGLNVTF